MGASYSLASYLDDDSITLEDVPSKKYPNGHPYRFASPTFEVGLWLKNLMAFGRQAALADALASAGTPGDGSALSEDATNDLGALMLDNGKEIDVYRRVMGDTFDQLRDDGVSWGHTQEVLGLLLRHWGSAQTIDDALVSDAVAKAGDTAGEAEAQPSGPSESSSSPTAGSRSNQESSDTRVRTGGRGSTPSRKISAARKRPARKSA